MTAPPNTPEHGARPPQHPGRTVARPLPYVACVSWPRSGHHLMVRVLQRIFKRHFGYCEYYGPSKDPSSGCCGAFPCAQAGPISMSKQHDFELDAALPEGHRLLVQYRKFTESIVSDFELWLKRAPQEDNPADFEAFARMRGRTYAHFMHKWVHTPRDNRVLMDYAELTSDPVGAIRKVLRLYDAPDYFPRIEAEIKDLEQISVLGGMRVKSGDRGIANSRDETAFRFYDKTLFDELEAFANRPLDTEGMDRKIKRKQREAVRRARQEARAHKEAKKAANAEAGKSQPHHGEPGSKPSGSTES